MTARSWGPIVLSWVAAGVLGAGVVLLLAATGVDIAALGIGSALATATAIGFAHHRSSHASERRQQARRQAHRESSPLWQPHRNDDVR